MKLLGRRKLIFQVNFSGIFSLLNPDNISFLYLNKSTLLNNKSSSFSFDFFDYFLDVFFILLK
jgi:hypothetical protein